jgi:hypothetical protein
VEGNEAMTSKTAGYPLKGLVIRICRDLLRGFRLGETTVDAGLPGPQGRLFGPNQVHGTETS